MAKHILLDEFHLTIMAAPDQPQRIYTAIVRVLDDPRQHATLRARGL